jgi:hypothetical protein
VDDPYERSAMARAFSSENGGTTSIRRNSVKGTATTTRSAVRDCRPLPSFQKTRSALSLPRSIRTTGQP